MGIAPVEINLVLVDQKVKFEAYSVSNREYPITFDYLPPLGEGQGILGLEGLVMSFAGCVSTAVVALLRRTGKTISGYQMNACGIKREKPLMLEKISFEVTLESCDISSEEVQSAMTDAAEISPVWIAIKNNVEVDWTYRVVRP
jgi:uncharacterized OsmC-like protein